jgi:hypothetical protein
MGVVCVGVRTDFCFPPFLTTSGRKSGAEVVEEERGTTQNFPHGVFVTRESLSGSKMKIKYVLEKDTTQ